ncbi:MAG: endonuclease/exonuclease/phosphatase family protein [Flavobacteriaceae bacterium]|nr:endonuclease/exonuclease/phosphatase family protein [Flavobacteriaceae bacterium]
MDKRKTLKLLVVFLFIMNQFIISQHKTDTNKTIKVMTYNIHHGVNNNKLFDLDGIANVILNENPDFVALQEVDSVIKRSDNLDLTKVLGQKTKMNYLFGNATKIDNGLYGVAILSKYPIIYSKNVALPFQKNEEPRTALQITSALPSGDTISFISTHLDYKDKNHYRKEQVQKINNTFNSNKYPTILAGDINDIPNSETLKILQNYWVPTYNKNNPKSTFPADHPQKKIDYILYAPKNKWKVISQNVVNDSIASDHRPYIVRLKLIK